MTRIAGLFPDPPKPRGFIWLAAITAESWLDKAEFWAASLELLEASLEVPDSALKWSNLIYYTIDFLDSMQDDI